MLMIFLWLSGLVKTGDLVNQPGHALRRAPCD